jgi:hypothetical protein
VRILLAVGALLLGLVLACVMTFVAWRYIYVPSGCFMWDPPSSWREPAGCRTTANILRIVEAFSSMAALAAPLFILTKKKR